MDKIRTIDDHYRNATASRLMEELVSDLIAGKTKHVGEATKPELQRLYSRLRSNGRKLRYQWQTVEGVDGYVVWAIPDTDKAIPSPKPAPESTELMPEPARDDATELMA